MIGRMLHVRFFSRWEVHASRHCVPPSVLCTAHMIMLAIWANFWLITCRFPRNYQDLASSTLYVFREALYIKITGILYIIK